MNWRRVIKNGIRFFLLLSVILTFVEESEGRTIKNIEQLAQSVQQKQLQQLGMNKNGSQLTDIVLHTKNGVLIRSSTPPPASEDCYVKIQYQDSFGILLLISAEMMAFLAGYILHETHFKYIQEAASSVLIGAIIGMVIRFLTTAEHLKYYVTFDVNFFYLILIPPIIFESGYTMKRKKFFDHIATILSFAFLGTAISAFVTGGYMIFSSNVGMMPQLTILECMAFGSLIAATDTVTILAIFKALRVDIDLYSNVFGESVLNDAVAIVLFRTIMQFADKSLNVMTILGGLGEFVMIFGGSTFFGVALGIVNTLLFRFTRFYKYPILETSIIAMFGFASYLLCEGLQLSGIVGILFLSVTQAHYCIPNLSNHAKDFSVIVATLTANLCDTLIFLYLGMALFSFPGDYDIRIIISGLLGTLLGRFVPVVVISGLFNIIRYKSGFKITPTYQFFLWLAGLRGGIAFCMGLEFKDIEESYNGKIGHYGAYLFTTTLIIAVVTIVVLGGSIHPLLERLKVPVGVDYDAVSSSNYPERKKSIFLRFDKMYIRPILFRPKSPEELGESAAENEISLAPSSPESPDPITSPDPPAPSNSVAPSDSSVPPPNPAPNPSQDQTTQESHTGLPKTEQTSTST